MRVIKAILINLLFVCPCQAAVFDHVQSKGTFISASGGSASFDSNTTAGNTLVLWCDDNSGSVAVPTVGGTGGITWTHAKSQGKSQCWVANNIPGGAVTVTLTNASSQWGVILAEFAKGTAPLELDQVASATGSSTTPASGNTPSTTAAAELVLGLVAKNTANFTVGSGFTERVNSAGYEYFALESKVVSSTGVQQADFTSTNSGTWLCMCVTLKESAAATTRPQVIISRTQPRVPSLLDPRRWIRSETFYGIAP